MSEPAPVVQRVPARAAHRRRFLRDLAFEPDPFQLQAFDAIDEGRSVLVSAPTGSGKTLIAAYAVNLALGARGKAFYTTPLKALSNQKFAELAAEHGSERVGLLTGDTALRPGAPVVVMTTEVLRNMLLAGSDLLAGLETVVLDEVHYLQDPYRGGVWEEVLVLCPPEVTFVCLSATVSNTGDLGAWLRSIRGPTSVVVERRRPVHLFHHLAVHRKEATGDFGAGTHLLPLLADGEAGAEAVRLDRTAERLARLEPAPRWRGAPRRGPRLPFRTPRRTELVDALADGDLLPSIVFIFSRAACDDAVGQCLREGIRLTNQRERAQIRRIAEAHVEELSDDALDVLGYPLWLEGLSSGVAAHHAGLVPAFRETVEECFASGLLQVVFATETLSLGINMPARTVAIERFDKYGSAGRAVLTSGEYAQLTGRAGRRGLDDEGHAVVLWSRDTSVTEMARIARAAPPDLHSSFRPTYNLAVNLVGRFDRATAITVLRRSFAQWEADAAGRSEPTPTRAGRGSQDRLVDHLRRRLAVLEELGYVHNWQLTDAGRRLSRLYHESDLLVAEIIAGPVLQGAEPSVVAGALSTLVFERRRARRTYARTGHRGGQRGGRPDQRGTRRAVGDRLGQRRRTDLADRLVQIENIAGSVRTVEEVHLVPHARRPEPGLAGAVCSWARGAPLGTVLAVAARDVGEIAPGDFVRIVKQLVDLAGQVALVAPDPQTAAAAAEAATLLRRDVVAAGGTPSPGAANGTRGTPGAEE